MDQLINLLFSPIALYALGAVALYYGYQQLAPRLKLRGPGGGLTADALIGRMLGPRYAEAKLEKAAAREKKSGSYLVAGRLYEDAGKLQQAADTYAEGQEYYAAAGVFEKLGKAERAGELYLQAGDYKKAALMFTDVGKPGRAAQLFLEKGNTLEAARLFGLDGQSDRAGELYLKAGYPLRAGEAWEKQGEFLKAAECFERHYAENVTYASTYSATASSADQKSARQAGRLFEKAGELERAYQVYNKGSFFKEAARVIEQLGEPGKAAELYMRAGDPERAAAAFEQSGEKVKAANLRGEVAIKADRVAEAAACFRDGQDYLRSAELFESIGMLPDAAKSYEAGESWVAAGNVYIRAGLKDRAAAAYERGNDFETSGKLYEECGNVRKAMEMFGRAGLTFKSGEAAAKAGDRERAIAQLQRVGPSDENYRTASEMLARLFVESNLPALAIERLQKMLGGEGVAAANLDLYYWLGVAHEAAGNLGEAHAIYKKIQAEDLSYKDVQARAARAQLGARSSASAPPAAASAAAAALPARAANPATLQICPSCGRCYDHNAKACADDAAPLGTPRVVPYVLLDRYRLVRLLGEGGMGQVFRAHDQRLDREVAIKIVRVEDVGDRLALARLEREARLIAKIHHPGIIGIYDSGELEDGSAFLVMELLEGSDLYGLLKLHGRGRPSQVAALLRQAGAALLSAHKVGVVHRDVKPQNIFLTNGEFGFQAKLLDFGIAKTTSLGSGSAHVTQSGFIVGTPAYMSPEQARNEEVGPKSDLYSLAVVGYEALTGVKPYPESGDILKTLFSVLNDPPPRPSSHLPGLPAEIDEAFAYALAKRPTDRPVDVEAWVASVADMLECVEATIAGWPDVIPKSSYRTGAQPRPDLPPTETVGARGGAGFTPAEPRGEPEGVRRSTPSLDEGPTHRDPVATPAPQPAPAAATPAVVPAPVSARPRFALLDELGGGSLGHVHRGQDLAEAKDVALRLLSPELLAIKGALQALTADLKAAAQVAHPSLVRTLGFADIAGRRAIVSEWVVGRNFGEAIKAGHKLPANQVASLGRSLLQVLAAIHAKGLVHGSLQPSNVMVAGGQVRVTDFGLGRVRQRFPAAYRAPGGGYTAADDLYSAAAVLYQLLTGQSPVGPAAPQPASSLVPGIPAFLERALQRALDPVAAQRPASAEQFVQELQAPA